MKNIRVHSFSFEEFQAAKSNLLVTPIDTKTSRISLSQDWKKGTAVIQLYQVAVGTELAVGAGRVESNLLVKFQIRRRYQFPNRPSLGYSYAVREVARGQSLVMTLHLKASEYG